MTPGPQEPSTEQLQHLMALVVDDLIALYETGLFVNTPRFPEGSVHLLHVSLLTNVHSPRATCPSSFTGSCMRSSCHV